MCTLLFSIQQHPDYPFVLIANRDEFYQRPSAPVRFWEDESGILGGQDLQEGGTWMGITQNGRFAALTNYREGGRNIADSPSRGFLVRDYLTHKKSSAAFSDSLQHKGIRYNGFNMLFGNMEEGWHCYSNRGGRTINLAPGLYGLSNHLLNSPWPKVEHGKQRLASVLKAQSKITPAQLLPILEENNTWPDDQLPDTGISLEWERRLSSIFITSENYGTCVSTIVLIDKNKHVTYFEKEHRSGLAHRFEFDLI